MNKLFLAGRIFFALGIIALGILQFIVGDYVLGRPPAWPPEIHGRLGLAYFSGVILILTGTAIILTTARILADKRILLVGLLLTGAIILFYSVMPYLPDLIAQLIKVSFPGNVYKSLALIGGVLIMAVSFSKRDNIFGRSLSDNTLIWIARFFIALFFIVCGILHIQFFEFVRDFIPAYIPLRPFWTYFTAVALISAGLGLLIDKIAWLTALLAGVMIFLWFILLHIPRTVEAPVTVEFLGVFESFAISGILFTLAGILAKKNLIGGSIHN